MNTDFNQSPSQRIQDQPLSTSQGLMRVTTPLHPSTASHVTNPLLPVGSWQGTQAEIPSQLPQTLGEVWALCVRHRRWCLGAGIAAAALILLSGMRTTPLYQSDASLELYSPPKPVNFQESGSDDPTAFFDISRVNTQRERLLSTPVLQRALSTSDLGRGPGYSHASEPVDTLRNRLTVTVNKDNFVFEVALLDEDRLRAQRGLKAVLDAYFAEQDDRAGSRANSSLSFLQHQVEAARHGADTAREEEQEFKREHNILSTDPEENLHSRTLREFTSKRSDLDQHRASSSALVEEVAAAMKLEEGKSRRDALMRIDPIGINQLVQKQQELLFQAEADAEHLAPRYGPKHPRMKEAQLAITERTKELDLAMDTARDDIITTDQQLAHEEASLDQLIAKEASALDSYRGDLNRLQGLTQKTKSAADLLDDLMKREHELDVVARLDAKQVIVNNPPAPAIGPVNLHVTRLLALALMLGSMTAAGAGFARELLDQRLMGLVRARELTGLPLLGMIQSAPAIAPLAGGDPELSPEIAAAFRSLRENLILSGHRLEMGRCLMITSPSPNEGKTSVASRLAVSFASAGARVLLVDADMRHPSQPEQMGVNAEHGLSSMLAGSDQIAPIMIFRAVYSIFRNSLKSD